MLGTGTARGGWFNDGTARQPVVVLGAVAAQQLGVDHVYPDQGLWLGGQWFNITGILQPSPLQPDVDNSALVRYPAAQTYLGYASTLHGRVAAGPPSTIYAPPPRTTKRRCSRCSRRPPTRRHRTRSTSASPRTCSPSGSRGGAFDSLFLGLGVVALIVGAVGVANIMIISVLERRSEIGLRRALGATKAQIRTQFLSESALLAVAAVDVLAGIVATAL